MNPRPSCKHGCCTTSKCPTCNGIEQDEWWWCGPCVFCKVIVCNSVVDRNVADFTSSNCWAKHVREKHPKKLIPKKPSV